MKLIDLIKFILKNREMSILEINRVIYMACYYFKSNGSQLIKNKWNVNEYGPYLSETKREINMQKKIKKTKSLNQYGRQIEKFTFDGEVGGFQNNEIEAINRAINDFNIICGRSHRPQAFCHAKW